MERHFHEQLQELKGRLVRMGGFVEESIAKAIGSFMNCDDAMADEVIAMDDAINRMELEIGDLCLKLIALQQPMAVDLRFLTSSMKLTSDLERMGDHSVNIAGYAKTLAGGDDARVVAHFPRMAAAAQAMVHDSLESFVDGDASKARAVCLRDDEVDALDDAVFTEVLGLPHSEAESVSRALTLVLISKNLERIADLSTNIAEEVIFIVQARNIKHHSELTGLQDIRHR